MRIRSQVMEQQVVGVKIESGKSIWKHESDTSIVNEIYRVQEISSEQPKVLENAPGTVTTTMDFPSTSCCMSNTHKEQMELASEPLNFSSNFTAVDVRTYLFSCFLYVYYPVIFMIGKRMIFPYSGGWPKNKNSDIGRAKYGIEDGDGQSEKRKYTFERPALVKFTVRRAECRTEERIELFEKRKSIFMLVIK